MKKLIFITFILLSAFLYSNGQDNIGSPYSIYGMGLLPENNGPYTAMGGVAAAMRDNSNINFLNPASYTGLDSNRFYIQLALNGEYTWLSNHRESSRYRVAQNANLNMAFRLYKKLFFSFGFTEKSDIGYDVLYSHQIVGNKDYTYFNQNIQGEGGLNDLYAGLGWRYKNFSIGMNFSYIFGKIEKRQTLSTQLENSYYIRTSENNRIHDVLFTPGIQYDLKLSPKSRLVLGTSMNFTQKLSAKKEFVSYKVNTGSGSSDMLDDETLDKGYIKYPFRILSGLNYSYKNKWNIAGDYTFQKMSVYEEFKTNQHLQDYHKAALGVSWLPDDYGRSWWQHNKYMLGTYFVRSAIQLKDTDINTYALTLGTQMPFHLKRLQSLLLGVAVDLGIRGTEKNGLIQERFVKVRINISFKEFWFLKQKIN